MVSRLSWKPAYHIVPSRYPTVGLFDDVADPGDLEIAIDLAAATNPRVLDQVGELRLVRDEDRLSGPGATPIMAAFTHAKPSRFGNGSFGIYYAAHDEPTAIAETAHHRGRFLRDAGLPNERLDMRVYSARVTGSYDDIRNVPTDDPRYDPDSYSASQPYGTTLYDRNAVDGIVFCSVRRTQGKCIAAFRPTRISHCTILHHLEYRFEGYEIRNVIDITARSPQFLAEFLQLRR